MNNDVVQLQSSVSPSTIAYKIRHINTSTSKNINASAIMSAKSTRNTLQLFTVILPFATMFVHVTFELLSRRTSKRFEILFDVNGDPMFTRHGGWIGITHQQYRFCQQAITAEYSIETFHIVTNHTLQFILQNRK